MLIGHSVADRYGTLLAVDPGVCEITQREERELIGVRFETLTHPDDCTRNVIAVASLKIGDGPISIRKRYLRPDGSSVWSQVQVSRLQLSGGACLVGTIQLISPERPESLWRAARLIDALGQGLRHELGDDLFADYGWLILLQIYLAEAEGRIVDVTSISETAAISSSSVIRWIEALEKMALVERAMRHRELLQLTSRGMQKVEALLTWRLDAQ